MIKLKNIFRRRTVLDQNDLFGDDWATPRQSIDGFEEHIPTIAQKELAQALQNQKRFKEYIPWLGSAVFGSLALLSVVGVVIEFSALITVGELCPRAQAKCGSFSMMNLAWFIWIQQLAILISIPILVYGYILAKYRDFLVMMLSLTITICIELIQAFDVANDQATEDEASRRLSAASAGFILIAGLDIAVLIMVGTMPGSILSFLNLDSIPLPFRGQTRSRRSSM
eukprot:CFRG4673T1